MRNYNNPVIIKGSCTATSVYIASAEPAPTKAIYTLGKLKMPVIYDFDKTVLGTIKVGTTAKQV